ncbi:hypothetical protein BOO71_0014965 [Deinococcus marmoris]|uniref:Uncharacterized protein n=1 Tax=Deinococcus marmoris TaxID=249408 RepID=A0A1U7NR70_9DEIO|nr:hypothetical protein BOO71_0014965 [Deinococcus marmoris]
MAACLFGGGSSFSDDLGFPVTCAGTRVGWAGMRQPVKQPLN